MKTLGKRFAIAFAVGSLLTGCATTQVTQPKFAADDETNGMMDFANVPSEQVLQVYSRLLNGQLIEDSGVKNHHRGISIRMSGTKEQALSAIENALIEQAGIVITRLGETNASVTFNDALPIKPVIRKVPLR